jgi:hypothetical protein
MYTARILLPIGYGAKGLTKSIGPGSTENKRMMEEYYNKKLLSSFHHYISVTQYTNLNY